MATAPNTRRKRRSVLESIFSESQPLPLHEYVKLITRGQIDLMVDPTNDVTTTVAAGPIDRKETEQRDYIQTIYVVPEEKPVIHDILQRDPAPINEIVRKLVAHAVRHRSTTLPSSFSRLYDNRRNKSSMSVDNLVDNSDGSTIISGKNENLAGVDHQYMSVLTLGYRQTRNTTQMAPIYGDADVECSHVIIHCVLI